MSEPANNPAPLRRWQWNSAEEAAFDDRYFDYPEGYENRALSAVCIVLYLRGLRRFMDYSSGLVGVRRGISVQMFIELLEEKRPLGSNKAPYRPTRDEIRWIIDELIRVGLVERMPKPHRMSPMVFRLLLAAKDVVRLNEEPPESPQSGAPNAKPELAVVDGGVNPQRTPRDEPHTSEAPKLNPKGVNKLTPSSTCSCPHAEILDLWLEIMPPSARRPQRGAWKTGRPGYMDLGRRWKDGFTALNDKEKVRYTDKASGLAWWRGFFGFLKQSSWLMNESRQFDFDWVLKRDNFRKAIERNFHDK